MEQNYRSSKEIVETANNFIKQNKKRYAKNMFTKIFRQSLLYLKNFQITSCRQNIWLKEIRDEESLSDIAVLYRNNASSIALMNEFDRAGIPFFMKDADNRFFSHWVVGDYPKFYADDFYG